MNSSFGLCAKIPATLHAKIGNVQFTTVPLKVCLIKYELDINVYNLKTNYSKLGFLYKSDLRISTAEKRIGINRIKHF